MAIEFETSVVYECRGEASARVFFVAVPTTEVDADALGAFRITGHVAGPTCVYSSTLEARIPLAHRGLTKRGTRTAIVAEAVVPDPCYWSTELPFLYRAVGAVECGEGERVSFDRTFGMRDLRIVRNKFALNGKIWVPRAVRRDVVVGDAPPALWRETDTAMSLDDPDEPVLTDASRLGVCVLANLSRPGPTLVDRLRRIAGFPAVMVVSIDAGAMVESDPAEFPNLVLAATSESDRGLTDVPSWSRAAVLPSSAACGTGDTAQGGVRDRLPIIVRRPAEFRTPAEARKACDELQADLAQICDPAGYIV